MLTFSCSLISFVYLGSFLCQLIIFLNFKYKFVTSGAYQDLESGNLGVK